MHDNERVVVSQFEFALTTPTPAVPLTKLIS
jgi:hypothetical protein